MEMTAKGQEFLQDERFVILNNLEIENYFTPT